MSSTGVLPWLAVREGRAVSPTGLEREGDAREVIGQALRDREALLLWDLDGMERGKPELDLYRRFEGRGLWVDAGVRNLDTLIDVLVAGAEVAVLNLRYLRRRGDLTEAGWVTEDAALCIEEDQGLLALDPALRRRRPLRVFQEAREAGIRRGVYLRHGGLPHRPDWTASLEGLEVFAGPAAGADGTGGVVVDLWRLA